MKIRKLETFCNEFVGFVRVTTDSGATGWGVEVAPQWLARSAYRCSKTV